jgi:uncharacterized repeat protein (TIGR01451 family)
VPLQAEASLGDVDAGARRWTVGRLEPGRSATLSVLVRVDAFGPFTGTAEVVLADQPDVDSVPADADARSDDAGSATVTAAASPRVQANLAVSQVARGPLLPGRRGSLVVTVTNLGPGVASGIAVTELLPAHLDFVSGGGDGWSCVPAAAGAVCHDLRDGFHGRRRPGETTPPLELVVAVEPDAPAHLTSTARVTSGVDDPQRSDDTAATQLQVDAAVTVARSTLATRLGGMAWVGLAVMVTGAGLVAAAVVLHRRARRRPHTIAG